MSGKRFAVLLCAEDSEYVKKRYGGYFGVFVNLLGGEEEEIWDVYSVVVGEFPKEEDISLYDGFVISGRAASGWDLGVTTINLSASKLNASLQIPSTLSVIECHRDEVVELPPSAQVIASSGKTRIEMFICGDHIMGMQGHPEYTKDILHHLLDRLLQRNLIQESQAELARASIEAHEPDREAWKKVCKGFLKGQLIL
ncbi:Gamma-glutamyl peptidase [Thalictrum thalictroides]|uniref:Gamma-glutamyl peptidase n=1 Tax=Thalictrum thalictroides TaxID=46969 RepID=A0A7J6V236_THATH|nr:Gamma-glutamyl peptidase [Thalictrum thalictroides]